MNGVLNLSVLDGWWLEGYREGAGWALTEKRTYDNQAYQDPLHLDISDLPMKRGITTNRNKFVLGPSGSGKSF